ncbi:MAG: Type 1 glutamine amidotransferase-like domain-containing protein [bacterium]|nr:Type 1 glutamine amidotransferase-like domain-containing protein [bacterium]
MKLYLSSYHLGNHSEKLKAMIGANKKAAVILNAMDFIQDPVKREESMRQELDDLKNLDLQPEELDLRTYFGKADELRLKLKEYGLVWVRGGNCFVLLRAMEESGFNKIIKEYRGKDELVYGGYSAGVCVITPTLKGTELVDDPVILPIGYKNQTIWDGVGLIHYSVAPHYHSNHPESEAINKTVEYFIENKMLFRTLKDGEVIIESV